MPCLAFVWVLGVQTQVLIHVEQALHPLSHLPQCCIRNLGISKKHFPSWKKFEQPEFVFIWRPCVLEVSTEWSLGQGQGYALGICLDGLSVIHGPCTECLLRFTGTETLSRESSRETRLVQVCVSTMSHLHGEISLKSKNCKNIWPQTSTNRNL